MSPARAIAYGLPGLATLFTFTMFTTYGLYFFTNVVGLSGSFAGLIMTIGTLWDAVTDPLGNQIIYNKVLSFHCIFTHVELKQFFYQVSLTQ